MFYNNYYAGKNNEYIGLMVADRKSYHDYAPIL